MKQKITILITFSLLFFCFKHNYCMLVSPTIRETTTYKNREKRLKKYSRDRELPPKTAQNNDLSDKGPTILTSTTPEISTISKEKPLTEITKDSTKKILSKGLQVTNTDNASEIATPDRTERSLHHIMDKNDDFIIKSLEKNNDTRPYPSEITKNNRIFTKNEVNAIVDNIESNPDIWVLASDQKLSLIDKHIVNQVPELKNRLENSKKNSKENPLDLSNLLSQEEIKILVSSYKAINANVFDYAKSPKNIVNSLIEIAKKCKDYHLAGLIERGQMLASPAIKKIPVELQLKIFEHTKAAYSCNIIDRIKESLLKKTHTFKTLYVSYQKLNEQYAHNNTELNYIKNEFLWLKQNNYIPLLQHSYNTKIIGEMAYKQDWRVQLNPDHTRSIVQSSHGELYLFDTRNGQQLMNADVFSTRCNGLFSPDGKYLALGEDQNIIICDGVTGQKKYTLIRDKGDVEICNYDEGTIPSRHWWQTISGWSALAFTKDSKYLISCSEGKNPKSNVIVWDIESKKGPNDKLTNYDFQITDFTELGVKGVGVNPDGKTIIIASQTKIVLYEKDDQSNYWEKKYTYDLTTEGLYPGTKLKQIYCNPTKKTCAIVYENPEITFHFSIDGVIKKISQTAGDQEFYNFSPDGFLFLEGHKLYNGESFRLIHDLDLDLDKKEQTDKISKYIFGSNNTLLGQTSDETIYTYNLFNQTSFDTIDNFSQKIDQGDYGVKTVSLTALLYDLYEGKKKLDSLHTTDKELFNLINPDMQEIIYTTFPESNIDKKEPNRLNQKSYLYKVKNFIYKKLWG